MDSVSRVQVSVCEGFVKSPLACAHCYKFNRCKSLVCFMVSCPQSFPQAAWKMFRTGGEERLRALIQLFFDAHFIPLSDQLVRATEYRAGTRAVGLSDQAFALHDVEDGCGASIADSEATL